MSDPCDTMGVRRCYRSGYIQAARETGGGGGDALTTGAPALEMRDVSKSFPGVRALEGVSFDCAAGEVHAICGENGAGKSTLIKVLGGIYQPDAGTIFIDGRETAFAHPAAARRAG